MASERITINLPEGFDPHRHLPHLLAKLASERGEGFTIESIDMDQRIAYAVRHVAIDETTEGDGDTITVKLARGTKPSDGDRLAAKYGEQYGDGAEMVEFDPYLGRAVIQRLPRDVSRCRSALAVALGCKAWDVRVTKRIDGGFDFTLPHSYVPSKHDGKLEEVATAVVGRPGWYVVADAKEQSASIIPGDPPTFPAVIPYDFGRRPAPLDPQGGAWASLPIGRTLSRTGGEEGSVLHTDFIANPHMLVSGTTGGGKGVTLTNIIAGALAAGWELAIVDVVKGGIDFAAFKPFVRDSGWGDELDAACAVLSIAYAEGARRKQRIIDAGVKKWSELDDGGPPVRPLLLAIDEYTSLIAMETVPKGVPKDSPIVVEATERNLLRATIVSTAGKIAREFRFAGISLVLATQVASTVTGVATEIRQNLGAKLLLGTKANDNSRRLALDDPTRVPEVPPNLVSDPDAGQGVGVFEFQGVTPGVFKSFFSPTDRYVTWLDELGVPRNRFPRPSPDEIARHTPSLGDGPVRSRRVEGDDWDVDPETGERLTGFARANAARHVATRDAHSDTALARDA